MPLEKIHTGAVLKPGWDDRPLRVLMCDEHEVMYDSWWPHKSAWGLTSLTGTIAYYRVPRSLLAAKSKFLRTEPLSAKELEVHRPDLPLRFATSPELEWPGASELPSFERLLSSAPVALSSMLMAPRLYLCPFGPKGSAKPGALVEAGDGEGFSAGELISRASELQAPFMTKARPTRGVGLFRLGLKSKVPSYYLWGHQSKADEPE